jgi:DNA-binding transcriptional ArsR family regulator
MRLSPAAGPGRGVLELRELERILRAIAHRTRRHVLVVLQARGGRMSAGAIARRFACSWPTTTRHLRVLESAGLVSVDRVGRERQYVLESRRLRRVVGRWLRHFDAGSSERSGT